MELPASYDSARFKGQIQFTDRGSNIICTGTDSKERQVTIDGTIGDLVEGTYLAGYFNESGQSRYLKLSNFKIAPEGGITAESVKLTIPTSEGAEEKEAKFKVGKIDYNDDRPE